MAVPKKKTSKAKSRSRRASAWRLDAPSRSLCPRCGGVEQDMNLPAGLGGDLRHGGIVFAPPPGFASFDPDFPGAYPFRVARPGLARPLLVALRPHARPDTIMQLVIEDDEPLYHRLLAVGAALRLEIAHLRGDLS